MRLVISGHGQDGHLSNRALGPVQSACPLVDRGKVCVHVSRISSSSWNLFSSGGYLTQGLCVVRHVCKNDEYVISLLDGEVLGGRESQSRGQYSLDSWVVCKVDKHGDVVEGTLF